MIPTRLEMGAQDGRNVAKSAWNLLIAQWGLKNAGKIVEEMKILEKEERIKRETKKL